MAAWITGLMTLSRYCQQPRVARGLESGVSKIGVPDIHRLCITAMPVDHIVGKSELIPRADSAWLILGVALALVPMMSTDRYR